MADIPTLMQVRRENKLESRQLADTASVELRIEYLAEIGGQIEEKEAIKLLKALSYLTKKHYTLQNVQINIRGDNCDEQWSGKR
jgi:hypothetical protein